MRELHSTDETNCGETLGDLEPVYTVLTVNHRGPLPLRELHSTDETIVWRDPGVILGLFTTC